MLTSRMMVCLVLTPCEHQPYVIHRLRSLWSTAMDCCSLMLENCNDSNIEKGRLKNRKFQEKKRIVINC